MASKKDGSQKATLEAPVRFGNFSSGDQTARLGVSIDRQHIGLADAARFLSGSRLEATLLLDPNSARDVPGQEKLLDDVDEFESVVDVKSFGTNPKRFTAGLTFAIEEIDLATVARYAKRAGTLRASRIGDIPRRQRTKKAANAAK